MKCASICILCKTLAATPLCFSSPENHPWCSGTGGACLAHNILSFFSRRCCKFCCFVIVTAPARVRAGVCAACSVAPARRVSTASGRTTTLTVAPAQAWSLVQCAERTSWKRSCCCSVSTVIGGCLLIRASRARHRLTD